MVKKYFLSDGFWVIIAICYNLLWSRSARNLWFLSRKSLILSCWPGNLWFCPEIFDFILRSLILSYISLILSWIEIFNFQSGIFARNLTHKQFLVNLHIFQIKKSLTHDQKKHHGTLINVHYFSEHLQKSIIFHQHIKSNSMWPINKFLNNDA